MSKDICARPIHPGEILKEEVEYRGLPQSKLAVQMGVSCSTLRYILNEQRPLTPQMALLFEAAMGMPADMLIGMQTDYNMRMASQNKPFAKRLAQVRRRLPIA
jgi:addiction module HigA family antidote